MGAFTVNIRDLAQVERGDVVRLGTGDLSDPQQWPTVETVVDDVVRLFVMTDGQVVAVRASDDPKVVVLGDVPRDKPQVE